jgi:hypothetical protein
MKQAPYCLILNGLPVDVTASQVMPMLDIKDVVALDTAGAMCAGGVLQEAQCLMPPIKLPSNLDRSVGTWLLERGYSLRDSMHFSQFDATTDWAPVMEQYSGQLYDISLILPNDRINMVNLLPRCSKLCVSGPLTDEQIEELCLNAVNVVELSVNIAVENSHPELLSPVLSAVPTLKKLSCSFNALLTARSALTQMGTKLKALSLKGHIAGTAVELITEVSALCPNLEHLHMVVENGTQHKEKAGMVLRAFAERCRSLSTVIVYGYASTTLRPGQLLRMRPGLDSIDGFDWSAEDLLAAAECGARLSSVDLNHALPGDAVTYTTLFSHVRYITLGHDFLVSPSAAVTVSLLLPCALDSVAFRCGRSTQAEAEGITAVLHAIACRCQQLGSVTWNGVCPSSASSATALAAVLTRNNRVTSVWLNGCRGDVIVTLIPQALADALAQCRAVQILVVERFNITDSQMLPIVASMRDIRHCNVARATGLSDAFLTALAEHCPDLSCLCVSSCYQLTEPALVQLTQRCRRLTFLAVHWQSMSTATAAALTASKRLYKLQVAVRG